MQVNCSVGAMRFVLGGEVVAILRPFASEPFMQIDPDRVDIHRAAAGAVLVVDHRKDEDARDVVRTEVWVPAGAVDGESPPLVVLCDARPGSPANGPLEIDEAIALVRGKGGQAA